MEIIILGIESSCDDTSAAIVRNGYVLSNLIANQEIHNKYGGVVPELASRAHQQNIIPVVDMAIKLANIQSADISAVAFTRGPGLMGSLLVGASFAKGFAISRNIPIIDVNHLQAHIISLFLREENENKPLPPFPFLCLLVSGGHSQLLVVRDHLSSEVLGQTLDDAAGEAFDKCAKIMGLNFPGGPVIDSYSKKGDKSAFVFNKPRVTGLNYSFSGLKTAFLYFLKDKMKDQPDFIDKHVYDICASLQHTIVSILMEKLILASETTGIRDIAIAGGVSANSGLREALISTAKDKKWNVYLPAMKFSTDNAAMIALAGYHRYLRNEFANHSDPPFARPLSK